MRRWNLVAVVMLSIVTVGSAQFVGARLIRTRPVAGNAGMVNLPWMAQDKNGNTWRVYQNGWLQQQGMTPQNGNTSVYSQGAQLVVNGNQPNMNVNMGRVDDKTGELVLENMVAGNFTVTRRIFVNSDDAYVRYVDIIKNTAGADQDAQIQLTTNLNYGVNLAQMVKDPKRKSQDMAWVAQTGVGNSVVEMFSGSGTKQPMSILWQQGNNTVNASLSAKVPAGKEVAIMHLHRMVTTQDQGVEFVNSLKQSSVMKNIPTEIRRLIVNFMAGQSFIGNVEILRGELLDVVELSGGDQLRGTLKEDHFALQTFYGDVNLDVNRVIGLINVGQFRPRQLVVTVDGQLFGGRLQKDTIDLQLSSGQVTKIPLGKISRVGYRKRDGEPEEWKFDRPMVLMRSGDRMVIQMPAEPLRVNTRYGPVKVDPKSVAAIIFQSEDYGVHEVHLTDGSKFAGLVDATEFEVKLGESGEQQIKFPLSDVARIQFAGVVEEEDDTQPTVKLLNDDTLVGSLSGTLKIDTAFDTISINASEIQSLVHSVGSGLDVQATLWDGTTVSGQLQDQAVQCQLKCGVNMSLPIAMLVEYQQPQPQPSAQMLEKIRAVIKELNADDWKKRDRAEEQLLAMGPVAIGVLNEMRANQPPEAQQRIDSIIQQLEKQQAATPASAVPTVPVPPDAQIMFDE